MEESPKALADELEQTADELEKRGDTVDREIDEARNDWERKRADSSVAGAPPRDEEEHGSAVENPIPDDVVDPDDAPSPDE